MVSILLAATLVLAQPGPDMGPPEVQAIGTARARAGLSGAQARLMAERGAQVVAARNAVWQSVQPPPGPGRYPVRIGGLIRNHWYGPTHFRPDGTATATVHVPR
jgi:hypothetical protein